MTMQRGRPYADSLHTVHGVRGSTLVQHMTIRDIHDCYLRAIVLSSGGACGEAVYNEACKGESGNLSDADIFAAWSVRLDPFAVGQNLMCEIERLMGIFPNIPRIIINNT